MAGGRMYKIVKRSGSTSHPTSTFLYSIVAIQPDAQNPDGSVFIRLESLQGKSGGEIKITPLEALFLRDTLNFMAEEGVFDLQDEKPAV